jgi:hypothetical protein
VAEVHRSTVFGLDVWADRQLAYLRGARAASTGRVLDMLVDRQGHTDWPAHARLISSQENPDGTLEIMIEADSEAGFLLGGARYGRHILSPEGRRLRCIPDEAAEADWQRFVIAQVLPFAAALQQLEVLHASAVAFGDRALALTGPSGAGKTSLALAACRLGASMIADDVLAVESREQELLAHPGAPVAGVAHAEADRLRLTRALSGALAVNERERLLQTTLVAGPRPLRAVLLLDRRADGPDEPRFEGLDGAGALLGSTFNFVLDDTDRLLRLLDICELASRGTVRRLSASAEIDSDRLALTIAGWFESLS